MRKFYQKVLPEMSIEDQSNSSHRDDKAIVNSQNKSENENCLGGPSFYPPLYIQRYSFVKDILDTLQPESVVDFGCSECGIFRHLKEVTSLLRISLVDIDSSTLAVNKYRIRPHCYDYLQKRKNPLHVQIFDGSATKFDKCLADYDAVVMVEFIEHLYEDDLKNVIKMVFGCINPNFVVMTTPNYDFNQLFPGPLRFRHYDHKFEWTRNQFQTWCNEICETYGYDSTFHGIGEGPTDSPDLGCCSQAAVLKRKGEKRKHSTDVQDGIYSLVSESIYPHQDLINKSPEEILILELNYIISFMSRCTDFYNDDETSAYIPINKISKFKKIECLCTTDELRTFLIKKNFVVSKNSENEDCVVVELYLKHSDDDDDDNDLSDEDSQCDHLGLTSNVQKQETKEREINHDYEELWD